MGLVKMKIKSAALICASLFTLTITQAANRNKSLCTTVDLRPEMGAIRNQGNKGWCYANAAADLLSFKLRNELHGQQASAGYTALTYLRNLSFDPIGDGGFVSPAIYTAEKFGLCTRAIEEKIESVGLKNLSLSKRLVALNQLKIDWDLSLKGHRDATKRFLDRYHEYKTSNSIVAQIPYRSLIQILTKSTPHTFISELARKICKGHIQFPNERLNVVFDTKLMNDPIDITVSSRKFHIDPHQWNIFAWGKDFIETIDQQLSKNNVIAIDYFANFLSTDFIKEPYAPRSGMHASVVVGRRWGYQANQCEYLIRNSWGPKCNSYPVKQNCEGGNLWVPEEVLRYNLYGYTFIK